MKKHCFLLFAFVCALLFVFVGCGRQHVQRSEARSPLAHGEFSSAQANAQAVDSKILVAFFSWSGNARALAGQIAQETGGDLFEIRTVRTYPDVYREAVREARVEIRGNARPALTGSVTGMEGYSTVFLCFPNWFNTMPMAVFTFLDSYDFSGKTIYPLVTHGGRRFGRSLDDMQRLCPGAAIGEGLSIRAMSRSPHDGLKVGVPSGDVSSWLRRLGL